MGPPTFMRKLETAAQKASIKNRSRRLNVSGIRLPGTKVIKSNLNALNKKIKTFSNNMNIRKENALKHIQLPGLNIKPIKFNFGKFSA